MGVNRVVKNIYLGDLYSQICEVFHLSLTEPLKCEMMVIMTMIMNIY